MNKTVGKSGDKVKQADFVVATFDDDRIRLPPDLSELAHLKGTDPIACWLLVVAVGRYRLLLQPMEGDAGMEGFATPLCEWEETASACHILERPEGIKRRAMRARHSATEARPTR